MTAEHLPVLLREAIEMLAPAQGRIYVDATIGLGGHAEELVKMIGREGKIIGIDRDERALARAEARLSEDRVILRKGKFSEMQKILGLLGISAVDGVLFDLGVSMMQLRDQARGFSFNSQERLDMRMDSSQEFSAWDIVNGYEEKDLLRILREYGEEYRASRIVRAIIAQRNMRTIDTCSELAGIVSRAVGKRGKIHPATKTFQAIRIEVNREIEELKAGLDASLRVMGSGGRLCVISYHSLEDRVVKNFMRERAREGRLRLIVKKPVVPGVREMRDNPSSRSAKLRGAELI
jgi:16S rRNA (cytosine1402-N4)-methyltransferase